MNPKAKKTRTRTSRKEDTESDPPKNMFPSRIPLELRQMIIDYYLDTVTKAAFMPVGATAPCNKGLALEGERRHAVRSPCSLPASCKQLRNEYLKPLRERVLDGKIPRISVNVFNFDFSPVTSDPVLLRTAQLRKENSSQALCTICIKLNIRRDLTSSPYQSDLRAWFAWRANEVSRRRMKCLYSLKDLSTDPDGMEELRQFLIPLSIHARDGADVCCIMNSMRARYFEVYDDEA